MARGATICFALTMLAVAAAHAETCPTGQSVNPEGASRSLAAQFRIARRIELIEWTRGAASLSASETQKLDELRAKVEELRQSKRWDEAEDAVNQAMKLLGIVNKAESALPGC